MELIRQWAPMLAIIGLTLGMHWYLTRRFRGWLARTVAVVASAWMVLVVPALQDHGESLFGPNKIDYLLAASLAWVMLMGSATVWLKLHTTADFRPERRRFLAAGAPVVALAPLVAAGGGVFVARSGMVTNEVTLKIKGLPKDLEGLRLAQLTDIHFGPFFGRAELERAVAMANECKPHITLLTGDMITRWGDDLEGCLRVLRSLKTDAGVFGCHGNHEEFAGLEEEASLLGAKYGFQFLRDEAAALRFGQATLNLAGNDYQRLGARPLPNGEELLRADAFNVLLQHNPGVFPRAAELGYDLMLAGHTHGGQINLGVLNENINVARVFTPFVRGEYKREGKLLYVSSGLGTVGVPVRLGAPPEVTVIRLCGA